MQTSINWMVFKPEGVDVLYIWNGIFPAVLHVAPHEGKTEDWYWNGPKPEPLNDSEKEILLDIAKTKRKQVFKVPGRTRRFQVVSRETYEYENPQ